MNDNFKLDFNNLDVMANFRNPLENVVKDAQRRQMQQIEAIEAARREKEKEAQRKHDEILEAIRSSSSNINIGGNATGIQIQQNSSNSSQNMTIQTGFDYEQIAKALKDIQSYTELPQFNSTYGENADHVKALIDETLSAVQEKQEPGLIKKSLQVLKDLTIGAGGSLIASGILALLGSLPLWHGFWWGVPRIERSIGPI